MSDVTDSSRIDLCARKESACWCPKRRHAHTFRQTLGCTPLLPLTKGRTGLQRSELHLTMHSIVGVYTVGHSAKWEVGQQTALHDETCIAMPIASWLKHALQATGLVQA